MLAFILLSLVFATSDLEEDNKSLRLIHAQLQKTLETSLAGEVKDPQSVLQEAFEAAQAEAVPLYELDDVKEDEKVQVEFEVAEAEDFETKVGDCAANGIGCNGYGQPHCSKCCSKATFWYGSTGSSKSFDPMERKCGSEPKWKDGSLCGIGTSCKVCKNSHSYWFTKAMTACGREKCLRDGSLCGLGTTCKACCRKAGYWYGKAMTACGREPCWGKGTWCLHGTSCNRCCRGANWWSRCK